MIGQATLSRYVQWATARRQHALERAEEATRQAGRAGRWSGYRKVLDLAASMVMGSPISSGIELGGISTGGPRSW